MEKARDKRLAGVMPIAALVAVVLVALLAPQAGGGPDAASASSALRQFESCHALGDYVRSHGAGDAYYAGDAVGPAMAEGVAASGAEVAPEGLGQVSEPSELTNVQEAGVDEPDLVKSDGVRVFAIAKDELHVLVVDGDELVATGEVELPGGAQVAERELLVSGDRVVVLGTSGPYSAEGPQTLLVEVDVSDLEAPAVARSVRVEGAYLSSRLNGTIARVVTSSGVGYPQPVMEDSSGGGAAPAGDEVVPSVGVRDHDTGERSEQPLVACEDVRRPEDFSGAGMLSVLTIDLEEGIEPVDSDSVMTSGETVYASAGALYVATQRWGGDGGDGGGDVAVPVPAETYTEIHRFEAGEAPTTEYTGTGRVAGSMLSQWSMSEHEGFLRVASTTAPAFAPVGDMAEASRSFVTVLDTEGEELDRVGRTEALGVTEQIYAVRFVGDLGFVVTFRQTDPLYSLDLSDPTDPHATGELKIPGYSAYLHPVGEDLLLGIGQDASADGMTRGSQVSLFDVSDLSAPKQLDRVSFGEGSSSEVEYEHHAFAFSPVLGLAVVPVSGGAERGATGLRVDEGRLSEAGSLDHPGSTIPPIRRSLPLGDSVLSYSDQGVALHDSTTLERLSWAPFGERT